MKNLKYCLVVVSLLLGSMGAKAQMESAGVLLGYSAPMGGDANVNSRMAFGAEGSYSYSPDLSIGAYFTFSSHTVDEDYKSRFIPIGLEVNYKLSNLLNGLYAGGNLGVVLTSFSSVTYPLWDGSSFDFSFGGQAGYDYKFMENFSAGAKVQMYYVYFLNEFIDHTFFTNLFLTAKYHF